MAPTLKPEPGDLIEIFRGTFQHWALYVGDGYVVHLAPACVSSGMSVSTFSSVMSVPTFSNVTSVPTFSSVMSVQSVSGVMSVTTEKALVKKENLSDVVGEDKWEINNSLDKKYKPRPVHVIVREALALVDKVLPYSVISRNCEHFVTKLRYGKAESLQVWKKGKIFLATVVAVAVIVTILALALKIIRFW